MMFSSSYRITCTRFQSFGKTSTLLDPVFHVGDDRLAMEWVNSSELDIRCVACTVTKGAITTQKNFQSGVTVHYLDFP